MWTWWQKETTLLLTNLPCWVDEEYLCVCFYHFDSIPRSSWRKGGRVKIVKDEHTGQSKGYGFMTFDLVADAEKVLHNYNKLKFMPGTEDRFCLEWAFPKSEGEEPKFKKRRTMNSSNNYSTALVQTETNNMRIKNCLDMIFSGRDYIHLDFIENIFLRLPAEVIVRLRRERKAWSIMTRTIHFTHEHLKKRKSQTDPIVAIDRSEQETKFYYLSNYSSEQVCSFEVLHFIYPYGFVNDVSCSLSNSCNGLVCVYLKRHVNVVNPTIQETIQLPINFSIYDTEDSLSTLSVGIGYDDFSDTYKIIRIYGCEFSSTEIGTKYEVFTLGSADSSCGWRQLEEISQYMADGKPPVFLNGAIHWVLLGDSIRIHSFDVRTEVMRILSVPEVIGCPYLVELGGCLCLIDWKSMEAGMYILEDYANWKWIKKHTIENFPDNPEFVATRDGNLLLHKEYYDMKERIFKKTISQSNNEERLTNCLDFRGCAESLVSPISYLQKSNIPCAAFSVFGQRWATQFPMNTYANCSSVEKLFFFE